MTPVSQDTRLDRYEAFIREQYLPGLGKFDEYSLESVSPTFISKFPRVSNRGLGRDR